MKTKHTPGPWYIENKREANEHGIEGIDISADSYK